VDAQIAELQAAIQAAVAQEDFGLVGRLGAQLEGLQHKQLGGM
jgi:hypothetical protein